MRKFIIRTRKPCWFDWVLGIGALFYIVALISSKYLLLKNDWTSNTLSSLAIGVATGAVFAWVTAGLTEIIHAQKEINEIYSKVNEIIIKLIENENDKNKKEKAEYIINQLPKITHINIFYKGFENDYNKYTNGIYEKYIKCSREEWIEYIENLKNRILVVKELFLQEYRSEKKKPINANITDIDKMDDYGVLYSRMTRSFKRKKVFSLKNILNRVKNKEKNVKIRQIIITAIISATITSLIIFAVLYGYELLPVNYGFNFETLGTYLAALGSIGAIFVIWFTTKKQIQNQNIQNNRPYLTIEGVNTFDEDIMGNEEIYLVTCKEAQEIANDSADFINKCSNVFISIIFKNIGYGIASNITFFNLLDSNKIPCGKTVMDNSITSSFPTKEIGKDDKVEFKFETYYYLKNSEDSYKNPDYIPLLLLYSDLNENLRMMYIGITFDDEFTLDYTFYQQGTNKFNAILKRNNADIKSIIKRYYEGNKS